MDIFCFKEACKRPPKFLCNCLGVTQHICEKHVSKHSKNNIEAIHSFKNIHKHIMPENHDQILKTLNNKIKELKISKLKFLKLSDSALQNLRQISNFIIKKFIEKISIYQMIYKQAILDKNVQIAYRSNWKDFDFLTLNDIDFEVNQRLQNLQSSAPIEQFLGLRNALKKLQFYTFHDDDHSKNLENDLYFFKDSSKVLVKFDTIKNELFSLELPFKENQGYHSSTCSIGENKLFHTGGIAAGIIPKTAYIIYLNKKLIKPIPCLRQRTNTCATYINGYVFLFGGSDGKILLKASEYYEVKTEKWFKIADTPKPIVNTSTINLQNNIVISAEDSFLHIYSLESNSYTSLSEAIKIGSSNLLIKDAHKIILLVDKVFISSIEDIYDWRIVSKKNDFGMTKSKPIVRDRVAYFEDCRMKIYKFNLDTYTLQLVISL